MTQEIAYEGMQVNAIPATFISRTVDEGETVKSGKPVMRGAEDRTCKEAASDMGFLGIYCPTSNEGEKGEYESLRIMTQGAIAVTVAGNVEAGDPVGFKADGTWGKAASANFKYAIKGAEFDTTATSGGKAIIRIFGTETEVLT